jgi:hypothetical protein
MAVLFFLQISNSLYFSITAELASLIRVYFKGAITATWAVPYIKSKTARGNALGGFDQ